MIKWNVLAPILVYVAGMIVIGYYANKKKGPAKNFLEGFFLGGRNLGPILLAFTMAATAVSASHFLGAPGMVYKVGFGFFLVGLCQFPLLFYCLGALGKKMSIIARRINAITITDIFRARFENHVLTIGSALAIIVFITVAMSAQIIGGARIIESLTGLPYLWGLLIFLPIIVIYIAIGGFMGDVWTDLIQGAIMVAGSVLLLILTVVKGGGLANMTMTIAGTNPQLLALPGPMGMTPLFLFSFFLLFGLGVLAYPPMTVRAMVFKDSRSMHRAIIIGSFIMLFFVILLPLVGFLGRYYFPNIDVPDKIIPSVVMKVFPAWLGGIFLTVPLAAGMSTIDSMFLVIVASIVRDIFQNYIKPNASEKLLSRMSYVLTFAVAVVIFLLAYTPPKLLVMIVIFAGAGVGVSVFMPLIFGLYWRRATGWGAACSFLGGLISYILLEKFVTKPLGMIPYVPSLGISIILMIVVSLLTKKPKVETISLFWGSTPFSSLKKNT